MEEILRRIEGLIAELVRVVQRTRSVSGGGQQEEARQEQRQVLTGTVRVSNLESPHPVSGTVSVSNLESPHPVSGTVSVSNLLNPHPVTLSDNPQVARVEVTTGCDAELVAAQTGTRVRIRGLIVSIDAWGTGSVRFRLRSAGSPITPTLKVTPGAPVILPPDGLYALGAQGASITFRDIDASCPSSYTTPVEVQIVYDRV
jgi:hypothetical protein